MNNVQQRYLAETDGSDVVKTMFTNEPTQFGDIVSTRVATTLDWQRNLVADDLTP